MLNIKKARVTTVMTLILSILTLYAALNGIFSKSLYGQLLSVGTISNFLLSGSLAQDIISLPTGLILTILSVLCFIRPHYKSIIPILGLTGYFFYGYGLYAMQGQYTSIYLIYLAIFGLSIYSLVFGLMSFEMDKIEDYNLPKLLRLTIAIFILIIIMVLIPLWLLRISPDIAKHIPGETYGVFILDLSIVFPALGIISSMLLRKKSYGNILAGIALFKVFTICLSVAFGEWFISHYRDFKPDYGMISIFCALTVMSFVLLLLYLLKYNKNSYMKT